MLELLQNGDDANACRGLRRDAESGSWRLDGESRWRVVSRAAVLVANFRAWLWRRGEPAATTLRTKVIRGEDAQIGKRRF